MSQELIDALNKARMDELSAIVQYMKHHYEAEGLESPEIIDLAKDVAKEEMKHAEMLGERINYLGGIPTKLLSPISEGGDLKRMVEDDLAKENGAIEQYKEYIRLASEEGDSTTRLMLEQILSDEESHANTWETVLGIK
jgi:bacterioferritin